MNIGVERQKDSITVDEATRNLARSCEHCCKKGYNFGCDCDVCPITIAHQEKLEAIITLRQIEHEKMLKKQDEQRKKEEVQRKLEECIKMIEDIYETMYCPNELDEHNEELDGLTDKWLKLRGGEVNVQ